MVEDWLDILAAPRRHGLTVTEVCRRYGISRKTYYARLARYRLEGEAGLAPRSRRPKAARSAVPAESVELVRTLRSANPDWGARRIRAELLRRAVPSVPAASTIQRILQREGLLSGQLRRRVDTHGTVSYLGRRIQLGAAARGRVVVVEQRGRVVRVLDDGVLVRELRLGPKGTYHGNDGKPTGRPRAGDTGHPTSRVVPP